MTRKPKIKDNPTYADLNRELKTAKAVYRLIKFFEFFGIKNAKLSEAFSKVPELAEETLRLSSLPDRFNKHYSKRGWVAFERMNAELMEHAIEAAESGNIDGGESLLVEYFSREDKLTWLLKTMSGIPAFRLRQDLAERALTDFLEGRYHASIPVVLLIMDGLVNDIEPTGFFAKITNVTVWDSVAGHSSGLQTLTKLMQKTRKKTNTEPIDIPYRHGIMHGRDLGYANKTVAAKTWAAFFAIGDWVRAKAEAPKKRLKREKKISWSELLNSIKRTEDMKKSLEAWEPREIEVGRDIPKTGTPSDFEQGSPERTLAQFLDYWAKRNYGGMASLELPFKGLKLSERAGDIRALFEGKEITGFEFTTLEDEAAAVTEINTNIDFTLEGVAKRIEKRVRLIYQAVDGTPEARGAPSGSWKVVPFPLQ